jgi:hypothetical protein
MPGLAAEEPGNMSEHAATISPTPSEIIANVCRRGAW